MNSSREAQNGHRAPSRSFCFPLPASLVTLEMLLLQLNTNWETTAFPAALAHEGQGAESRRKTRSPAQSPPRPLSSAPRCSALPPFCGEFFICHIFSPLPPPPPPPFLRQKNLFPCPHRPSCKINPGRIDMISEISGNTALPRRAPLPSVPLINSCLNN